MFLVRAYKSILSFTLITATVVASQANERKLYVGQNATEATVEFDGTVLINGSRKPTVRQAQTQIFSQITHLFGPLGESEIKAVPKTDEVISAIKVEKTETAGEYKATYHYKGTFVVDKKAKSTLTLTLPANPATIYKESMLGRKNPCTDDHYQDEGDFWYFWSPEKYGCKLEEGKNFFRIEAKLKRQENTKSSYP